MLTECIEVQVSDLVWREDLYPRFEPNPAVIQQYADSIEQLPPIEINQRNEIIDGYHRWTAHRKVEAEKIAVVVTETKSDQEFLRLAIRRNAQHGLQLSNAEKKDLAVRLYTGKAGDKEELSALLSVGLRTLQRWTERRDKELKERRDKQIADMWLACYTQEEIAEAVGLSDEWVRQNVQESQLYDTWPKLGIFSAYQDPGWVPPLYDVWKVQNKSNKTAHAGNTEAKWVDNLLYMYTEPFDIVVDPFGGGGATIDLCKKRLRRYWVSDRKPIVERTDIRQWDILDGAPLLHKRWGDVALMYLDPPYWKQAEGQYSDDPQDLANMTLDGFYEALTGFVAEAAGKMHSGAKIALIIQPTQWKAEDRRYPVDHVVDLIARLQGAPMRYVRRIVCPYESQQYNAQQVEWAKASREVLVISREIIVWEVCR